MSILLISITLAPDFSSSEEERLSVGFLALKEISSSSDKVIPLVTGQLHR